MDHAKELRNAFNNIAQSNHGRDRHKKAWPPIFYEIVSELSFSCFSYRVCKILIALIISTYNDILFRDNDHFSLDFPY